MKFYSSSIGCVDQYRVCNPVTQACTPFGGAMQLANATPVDGSLALNPAQWYTARRLILPLITGSTGFGALGLGSGGKRLWIYQEFMEWRKADVTQPFLHEKRLIQQSPQACPQTSGSWRLDAGLRPPWQRFKQPWSVLRSSITTWDRATEYQVLVQSQRIQWALAPLSNISARTNGSRAQGKYKASVL